MSSIPSLPSYSSSLTSSKTFGRLEQDYQALAAHIKFLQWPLVRVLSVPLSSPFVSDMSCLLTGANYKDNRPVEQSWAQLHSILFRQQPEKYDFHQFCFLASSSSLRHLPSLFSPRYLSTVQAGSPVPPSSTPGPDNIKRGVSTPIDSVRTRYIYPHRPDLLAVEAGCNLGTTFLDVDKVTWNAVRI